jgi:transposase-like protein
MSRHHRKPPKNRRKPRSREFDPEIDPLLVRWSAQRQATLADISRRINVPQFKLREWLNRYPELASAFFTGQHVADARVIDALFKRATGCTAQDLEIKTDEEDKNGKPQKVKRRYRNLPADICAIRFWLKNRLPNQWADRPKSPSAEEITARFRPITQLPELYPQRGTDEHE